jgi:hypothetical protein
MPNALRERSPRFRELQSQRTCISSNNLLFLHKEAILFDFGETPDRVWYITRGAVSLFVNVRHCVIEAAMIGREGAVSHSGIARTNSIPLYTQLQIKVEALEIDVLTFHHVLRQTAKPMI